MSMDIQSKLDFMINFLQEHNIEIEGFVISEFEKECLEQSFKMVMDIPEGHKISATRYKDYILKTPNL